MIVALPQPVETYERWLAAQGKRMTEFRRMVAGQVFKMSGSFDAEQLLDAMARRAGRATVYRTLNELVSAGLLQRSTNDDGISVFQLVPYTSTF